MRLPLLGKKQTPNEESLLEFLHQVSILRDLTPAQLAVVSGLAEVRQFRHGSPIISEGEAGDCMFFLTGGTVEISKALTLETSRGEFGTKEKILTRGEAARHACFGEMALLGTEVRTATVTAITDCTVLVLTRDDLAVLEREHPEIAYAVVRRIAEELCARVRGLNQDVLKLTTALSMALSR